MVSSDPQNQQKHPNNEAHVSGKRSSEPKGGKANLKYGPQNQASLKTAPPNTDSPDIKRQIANIKDLAIAPQSEDESEICSICAEFVIYYASSPCNHRICHVCALRLRVLYKTINCAYCKTEQIHVIFTKDAERLYLDFKPSELAYEDKKLGISFESEQMMEDSLLLLRFNCPDPLCVVACKGWPDLRLHVRQAHEKLLCSLCTQHKKVFTHEHTLFSQKELTTHFKLGDQSSDQFDSTGFKGHPECGFCRKSFYDDDELFKHCREHHEKCHLCDCNGGQPQYFINYESLENHFRRDHFMCPFPQCLEQKFVVFASELDFKAHHIEKHPHALSSQEFKDIRRVTTSFMYEEPSRYNRIKRPQPTPQPPEPPRDESSMTRQERGVLRAVQAGLIPATTPSGRQYTVPRGSQQSVPVGYVDSTLHNRPTEMENAFPSLAGYLISQDILPVAALQDDGRNGIIFERLLRSMKGNESNFQIFRINISAYHDSQISAEDMIDSIWDLFGLKAEELGKVVSQCADLFDREELKVQLLSAWNDWKVTNQSQKSHLGISGLTSYNAIGNVSRVLKIKSSTASTTHPRGKHQNVWNMIEQAANRNIRPDNVSLRNQNNSRNRTPRTVWPAESTSNSLGSQRELEFPSLPTSKASQPHKNVDRSESGSRGNGIAWDGAYQCDNLPSNAPELGDGSRQGRRKQKGKQVIFKIGL
ncbi:E3 ubiquitin-protein ligase hel2 [Neolecta irregularis DAH-3]|uniref:RING-type E3 ubiquitin transferase n=1 Tax=Neolecta irregularis (strain DAH-3) TaxID=1198029 RepID=A0A1U7LWC7_NEOID|nr:E3 ubiquitin-protein ligase hel2 [Neolecta irregularis DAH-3]|eukprot:OLL26852.1 E3 ubiquitin-protein ligase hel2 [Neolecta irregularis DAH-3]